MTKIERILLLSLVTVVFLAGVFIDFKVTQKLFMPDNIIGKIGETVGEIPTFLLLNFSCALLFRFHFIGNKKAKVLSIIISLALVLGAAVYGGKHLTDLIGRVTLQATAPYKYLLWALISLAYIACTMPFAFMIKEEFRKEAFSFAVFFLVLIGCSVLLMQAAKMIWIRPRYRTLVALYGDDASYFWKNVGEVQFFWNFNKLYGVEALGQDRVQNAMEILGISKWGKEEFYSFPSGHTLNSLICASSFLFATFIPKLKGKELYFRIGFYVFSALIAFTRIMRGAHNLTDVAFGYFLGLFLLDILLRFFRPWFTDLMDKFQDRLNVQAA